MAHGPGLRSRSSRWLVSAAAVPVVLTSLPLVYLAIRISQAGASSIVDELFRSRTLFLLLNTVTLAVSVTLGATVIGTAVAWCVERTDLPGRRAWRAFAGLPLAVPAFVSSYAWSSIDRGFQSMPGAIMILTLSSYPLVYLPVAAALRHTDASFEDVSRSLGHGPWHTFIYAVRPQIQPALGSGAVLVLGHMLAEFGALAMLRVQTFTTAIFESYELQFDSTSAALQSTVLMALCLPAAWGEMRLRTNRRVARIGRGNRRRATPITLGWAKPLVVAGFVIIALIGLGAPLSTLVYWLSKGHSAGLDYADVLPAIQGSLSLSFIGAVLTSVCAIPLVLLAVRHRSHLSILADRLPYIIHGLPGVVVALALVFLAIRIAPALYQTTFVLLCAYVILFLPLAQSSLRASVELASPQMEDIARSLGRRPVQAFISVTLPNIAPGIGAAMALMMLEIIRELTATLMLAPTDVITLATEVWTHTADVEYAAAAPFAALLVLLSLIPVYIFTQRLWRYGEEK
ncbi:iron ABC transporter permease [Alcaligenaceae bacterium CGII-47]|nr:iron ABC transporter permease [Alcaligenaceae bacterium CGII-47]